MMYIGITVSKTKTMNASTDRMLKNLIASTNAKMKDVHLLWNASFHVPGIENLRVREVRISLLVSSSLFILHR